jgi:hypothetical protein
MLLDDRPLAIEGEDLSEVSKLKLLCVEMTNLQSATETVEQNREK